MLVVLLWSLLQLVSPSGQGSHIAAPDPLTSVAGAARPIVLTRLLVSPQREVDVAKGRRLNLLCLGVGTPTVIFESGTGGGIYDWLFIQAAVARRTTACAYDRAGFGFSDPARRASDVSNAVVDLQQLITKAPLRLPLILVGHSNGGMYAVRFAELHRNEVAGLILVDPGFTGQQQFAKYGLAPAKAKELEDGNAEWIRFARHCLAFTETGALTGAPTSPCLDDPPNLVIALHRALDRIQSQPAFAKALLSEFTSTFQKVDGMTVDDREVPLVPASLGELPLSVLTASRHPAQFADFTAQDQARYYDYWKVGHDRLESLSICGHNVVVANSGHFIQYDQPQVVISSILKTVAHARIQGQD